VNSLLSRYWHTGGHRGDGRRVRRTGRHWPRMVRDLPADGQSRWAAAVELAGLNGDDTAVLTSAGTGLFAAGVNTLTQHHTGPSPWLVTLAVAVVLTTVVGGLAWLAWPWAVGTPVEAADDQPRQVAA